MLRCGSYGAAEDGGVMMPGFKYSLRSGEDGVLQAKIEDRNSSSSRRCCPVSRVNFNLLKIVDFELDWIGFCALLWAHLRMVIVFTSFKVDLFGGT